MSRSLLGTRPVGGSGKSQPPVEAGGVRLSAHALDVRLRQQRSSKYVETCSRLDAGGHVHDASTERALLEALSAEFPEVHPEALPVGIVGRCYLGPPYEVHTLDCAGQIIHHYKRGESLAPLMERARSLSLHPGYAFVEVYTTKLIAVSPSGQTAVLEV
jgi:hypothetical protein